MNSSSRLSLANGRTPPNGSNNNETVIVVRMLDYPRVKVRNVDTAATVVADASKLLTDQELKTEERNNKLIGWGAAGTVAVCLMKGGC